MSFAIVEAAGRRTGAEVGVGGKARSALLAALMVLSACGEYLPAEAPELASSSSMLASSVVARGCTYTFSTVQRPGAIPPVFDYYVGRLASATCPYPAASRLVSTYSYSSGAYGGITGNNNGIAVAYVLKGASGSSPVSVGIQQIALGTLSTVRSAGLGCPPEGMTIPSAYLGDLFMLNANGTTVQVSGTKGSTCKLVPGQYGTGGGFNAYFCDFFTTTSSPIVGAF